jgi:hypothetical protein
MIAWAMIVVTLTIGLFLWLLAGVHSREEAIRQTCASSGRKTIFIRGHGMCVDPETRQLYDAEKRR